VPFYSQIDFFGNLSGRHSALASCGGFQPSATPSLSACLALTPPGIIYLLDYTFLDKRSQCVFQKTMIISEVLLIPNIGIF